MVKYQELITKIEKFRNIENNWDHQDAIKPSETSINNSLRLIERLDEFDLTFFDNYTIYVTYTVNGGVGFQIKDQGNKMILIEFLNEGSGKIVMMIDKKTVFKTKFEEYYFNLVIDFLKN